MFEGTFILGDYPMQGIEWLVGALGSLVRDNMSEGPLKDLLVDGIIGGVGGVIVFLPNILILYFFISLMEDSGYMARAAFIMDKIMHKMGLHGKSFIPLIMGFGCNVPAIMASRTIENRKSRLVTMLINPLMSCSARLPIYLLLVGAFFPNNASLVLLIIYAIGILLAVVMARLFCRFLVKEMTRRLLWNFPLPHTDVEVHFSPYLGERRAISAQNGRYHHGGFHCDMGVGVLSGPRCISGCGRAAGKLVYRQNRQGC